MDFLSVSKIVKRNERGDVLTGLSFTMAQGGRLAMCGETGSGKSTLLRIIAGLVQADGGEVTLESRRVKGPDEQLLPGHKDIAYLSQQYELRNHYRVHELLEMASRVPDEAAAELYRICRIDHLTGRKTDQLSGGEKQRVALARLLVGAPRLLLLDEPFSNLDLIHKRLLKAVVDDLCTRTGITCILASHDPQDFLAWADDLLILKGGTIVQQGPPEALYRRPVNEYAGALLGDYNLVQPHHRAALGAAASTLPPGRDLFLRPEFLAVKVEEQGIVAAVLDCTFSGATFRLMVRTEDGLVLQLAHPVGLTPGTPVRVAIDPSGIVAL